MIRSDKYHDMIDAREFIKNNTMPTSLNSEFLEYCISRENRGEFPQSFEWENEFMTEKGYVSKLVNNTYNAESDLDANIRYQVWTHKSVKINDVFWSNHDVTEDGLPGMVTSIAYNYADPRGGYDGPELTVPHFSGGEYSCPVDLVLGYQFTAADKNDAEAVACAAAIEYSGKYDTGYSSNPYYNLESDAGSLERDENGKITVIFDGHTLIAHPYYPYY